MSPIIVFAFNRLNCLISSIEALKKNPEAAQSDIFFFVDGPRTNRIGEEEKVFEIQNYIKTIKGFKSINFTFSEKNKGLAPSIIAGVTEVITRYGTAIVLEDDLCVSKDFLRYMNQMLREFRDDNRVFQISGFSPKIRYGCEGDIYFNGRAQCWSWATWIDRWNSVDWDVKDYQHLISSKKLERDFNSHGSDLSQMLKNYMEGKISSWFIRFCYSMHKQNKYCVCPCKSLVRNDGFNNEATNCKNYNRYTIDFEKEHRGEFLLPPSIQPDPTLIKESIRFWTIRYRIYGKVMTYLTKIGLFR